MRRILVIGTVLIAAAAIAVLGTGAGEEREGGYELRAIFDNAFSIIEGEDVRIAGVTVGKIEKLEITRDNKAAVVMSIKEPGFQDFREDAECTIRPQSLIGEKYVECTPTQPHPVGEESPPALKKIPEGRPGAGQYLLPVEQTSRPVDLDLVNNIMRLPQRQKLAIILNELGIGLSARGEDLNETIRRANPSLKATNEVLSLVAKQNRVLADLARNSDRVLAPLARDRRSVANFIEEANTVARATAERRADLERTFARLPRFLAELRPTMVRLGALSNEMTPVLNDLRAVAPETNEMFRQLGPFSRAGIPALRSLGEAADIGGPALVRSKPLIDDLRRLAGEARPLTLSLRRLLESFRDTGGIERLMDYTFYQVAAVNGFDQFGHYLRAGLIANQCVEYSVEPIAGCSSRFTQQAAPRSARAAADEKPGEDKSAEAVHGERAIAPAVKQSREGGKGRAVPKQPLKMPRSLLPDLGSGPAVSRPRRPAASSPSAPTDAQEGMLDYLLGGGS
jgi:virulence factor Mce-like protein